MDHKEKIQETEEKFLKIRITMTSTKVKQLEKVSADIVHRAKSSNLQTKGPVRLPTKVLRITTRKTPNGEGSKTWDTYEMRIHKRTIDLFSPPEIVKKITSFNIEAGINVEITVAQ
ncbi:small ribosomal subunit protein uS10 [Trichomonascus vanleenenianus]|uniref:40S ribosomal protein uS10 RPS20 n=1 Tax=Trichomonascus vanleenenianus TaxID=2268995 RepID=UPI003ECA51B0